jgi:RecD/TraA family predicted helicase
LSDSTSIKKYFNIPVKIIGAGKTESSGRSVSMNLLVEPVVNHPMYKGLKQFYVSGDFSVMFNHKTDKISVDAAIKRFNDIENESVNNGKKVDSIAKVVVSGYWDQKMNNSFVSSSYCNLSSYYENIRLSKDEAEQRVGYNLDPIITHVELGTYVREILTNTSFRTDKLSNLKKIKFNHLSEHEVDDLFSQVPGKVKSRLLVDIIENPSHYVSRRGNQYISKERLSYFSQALKENPFLYKAINDYSFMRILGLSEENSLKMISDYGLKSLKTLSSRLYTLEYLSLEEKNRISLAFGSKDAGEVKDVYIVMEAMKRLNNNGSTAFPVTMKWKGDIDKFNQSIAYRVQKLKEFKYSIIFQVIKQKHGPIQNLNSTKARDIEKIDKLVVDALLTIRRSVNNHVNGCKGINYWKEINGTKVIETNAGEDSSKIDRNKYENLSTYLCELDNYRKEKKIVSQLKRLIGNGKPTYAKDSELVFDGNFEPYPAQVKAVKLSFAYPVSIITGGPGVGKTTVLNSVLKTIESLSAKGTKIKLFAPTGKAASRMSDATAREGITIHSGLGYKPGIGFTFNDKNKIETHVLVIDESSMIDSEVFGKLLSALKSNTKLIIVGDKNQLPSVGAGAILQELIASQVIPFTILNETRRQGADSDIVIAAYDMIENKMPKLKGKNDNPSDLIFIEANSDEDIMREIKTLMNHDIPNLLKDKEHPEKGGYKMSDVQMLSPRTNKSKKGLDSEIICDKLNSEFGSLMNESKVYEKCNIAFKFRLGDRIMCNQNDSSKEISNGHQGVISRVDNTNKTVHVKFEHMDEELELEQSYLQDPDWRVKRFSLSYSMTIHKSQGSEYPIIIIPISKNASDLFILNAQLLYTAITRGKAYVYLVGSKEAMEKSISKTVEVERTSALSTLLKTELPVLEHHLVNPNVPVIFGGGKKAEEPAVNQSKDPVVNTAQEKTPVNKTFDQEHVPYS